MANDMLFPTPHYALACSPSIPALQAMRDKFTETELKALAEEEKIHEERNRKEQSFYQETELLTAMMKAGVPFDAASENLRKFIGWAALRREELELK